MSSAADSSALAIDQPRSQSAYAGDLRRALRACGGLALICAVVWIAAYWADRRLPYIRPGSEIMYIAKTRYMETHPLFAPDKPLKVLVLGNSKVMSGFIPEQFDREVPGATSFNAGFPNAYHFLPQLKAMLANGQVPTHLLYMVEWRDLGERKISPFHFLPPDREIMDTLFPFRMVVRDGAIFLMRSKKFGGPRASYRNAENQARKMEQARGYYFIENTSRYAGQSLPADFHLASDNSSQVEYRNPMPESTSFRELKALADQYHFKIIVMPYYLRRGERGEPGVNQQMLTAFQSNPEFRLQGNEYYLLDNHYFSDTAHLNPEGARVYTGLIAGLMNAEIAAENK